LIGHTKQVLRRKKVPPQNGYTKQLMQIELKQSVPMFSLMYILDGELKF